MKFWPEIEFDLSDFLCRGGFGDGDGTNAKFGVAWAEEAAEIFSKELSSRLPGWSVQFCLTSTVHNPYMLYVKNDKGRVVDLVCYESPEPFLEDEYPEEIKKKIFEAYWAAYQIFEQAVQDDACPKIHDLNDQVSTVAQTHGYSVPEVMSKILEFVNDRGMGEELLTSLKK